MPLTSLRVSRPALQATLARPLLCSPTACTWTHQHHESAPTQDCPSPLSLSCSSAYILHSQKGTLLPISPPARLMKPRSVTELEVLCIPTFCPLRAFSYSFKPFVSFCLEYPHILPYFAIP
jgi:hypothetical protein